MLNDEEQLAFQKSVENVRVLAARHLKNARDAANAVQFVNNLHRGIDKIAHQAAVHGPKPECTAGCAYCCRARVEATEPEIFLICREIRKHPGDEIKTLVLQLQKRVEEDLGNRLNSNRPSCVFLVNNLCSIYEVRPAVCRRAHSLSVEHCKNFSAEIPQNLELILDAEALMKGTSAAYIGSSLQSSGQELSAAVLMALTNENIEARWFKGEVHLGATL